MTEEEVYKTLREQLDNNPDQDVSLKIYSSVNPNLAKRSAKETSNAVKIILYEMLEKSFPVETNTKGRAAVLDELEEPMAELEDRLLGILRGSSVLSPFLRKYGSAEDKLPISYAGAYYEFKIGLRRVKNEPPDVIIVPNFFVRGKMNEFVAYDPTTFKRSSH